MDGKKNSKRTNLNIQDKKSMVEEIRDGLLVRNVGKKYGISRSQVYRFLKNKGSPVQSRDVPLHSKIGVSILLLTKRSLNGFLQWAGQYYKAISICLFSCFFPSCYFQCMYVFVCF